MRTTVQTLGLLSLATFLLSTTLAIVRAQGPSTAMFMLVSVNTVGFSGGGEDHDIYLAEHDGRNLQAVIYSDQYSERFPQWSPAGDTIVYTARDLASSRRNLALYDLSTGRTTILTDGTRYSSPVFMPNPQRIAYTVDEFSVSRVASMALDGSDRRYLITAGGNQSRPKFSPDGRYVVFATVNARPELWRYELQTGKSSFLVEGQGAVFGHDGAWLYYVDFAPAPNPNPIIMRIPADNPSQSPEEIVRLDNRLDTLDLAPSPDGRYLYYASRGVIWRVPVNGGPPETFLQAPLQRFTQPAWSALADEAYSAQALPAVSLVVVVGCGVLWWRVGRRFSPRPRRHP